jgi:hypothetical protein
LKKEVVLTKLYHFARTPVHNKFVFASIFFLRTRIGDTPLRGKLGDLGRGRMNVLIMIVRLVLTNIVVYLVFAKMKFLIKFRKGSCTFLIKFKKCCSTCTV